MGTRPFLTICPRRLPKLIDRVEHGETLTLTRRGKPVARRAQCRAAAWTVEGPELAGGRFRRDAGLASQWLRARSSRQ